MKKRTKQPVGARKPFYHITAADNVKGILQTGLKGGCNPRNRGGDALKKPSIFVLTDGSRKLTNNIAASQIWPYQDIQKYAVIEVQAAGISGKVKPDCVGELTAVFHRIVEQEVIKPKYLKATIRRFRFPGTTILTLHQSLHQRMWTEDEWAIARKWFSKSLLEVQEGYEARTKKRRRSPNTRSVNAKVPIRPRSMTNT